MSATGRLADAQRAARHPRRGARRDRRNAGNVISPRRDTNWWGWATRSTTPSSTRLRWACSRERIGELEPWPLAAQIEGFELPAARELPQAAVDAVGAAAVFTSREDRLRHACGRGYVDLARLRSGRLDDAPDAVVVPGDAAAVGRLIDACAAHGSRWCPFGGGTSVVGGVEPLRGNHQVLISLDLTGLREVERRRDFADRAARRRAARSRGRGGARRAGTHPRPLPAVLRVRDDRRLRGDPFGRSGLERLRPLRCAGSPRSGCCRRRATSTPWKPPTLPPGRRCARVVIGSEGTLGVIPRRHTCGSARRRPSAAMRPGSRRASRPGLEIVRVLAQGPGLPTVIRVFRRGGDARLAGPLGAAWDGRAGLRQLPEGAAADPAAR